MNYLISYPRSGNTMTRYLIELMTHKPTNGLCGKPNAKDNLQQPLIYKTSNDFVLHKRHDFRKVLPEDMVIFIIRDPLEAIIRHNERPRGIAMEQMYRYIDGWYFLLNGYDQHKGNKMCLYYEEVQKIAAKESRAIYRGAESRGPDWHKSKLGADNVGKLIDFMRANFSNIYDNYIKYKIEGYE